MLLTITSSQIDYLARGYIDANAFRLDFLDSASQLYLLIFAS